MANLIDFFGVFKKLGSKLTRTDFHGYLQVGRRKVTTAAKSPYFLIYKTPEQERYISSMYPLNDALNVFKIEFGGKLARVEYTDSDTAIISPWEGVCVNINYKP